MALLAYRDLTRREAERLGYTFHRQGRDWYYAKDGRNYAPDSRLRDVLRTLSVALSLQDPAIAAMLRTPERDPK